MEYLQSIVLGAVQGLTEFLPVSSDGHLTLIPLLFGWKGFDITFDVALHVGTLLATVVYFRKDVVRILAALLGKGEEPQRSTDKRIGLLMIVATVVSIVVALLLESTISSIDGAAAKTQGSVVGFFLLVTAAVLLFSEYLGNRRAKTEPRIKSASGLSWGRAAFIGFAQGLAPFQGLSRSGMTIASGLMVGMEREESARFSFLLSIPIVFAAAMKKLVFDLLLEPKAMAAFTADSSRLGAMLVGMLVTAVVGYGAIKFMLPFVRKHSLGWFAAYTTVVGIGMLVWSLT